MLDSVLKKVRSEREYLRARINKMQETRDEKSAELERLELLLLETRADVSRSSNLMGELAEYESRD